MAKMIVAGGGSVSYETSGCQGNARTQLYGSVELFMASSYLPQIQGSAFTGFLGSYQPSQSALRAWQVCMRADSLPATNPDTAASSLEELTGNSSATDLTHRQTTLATADVACDGKSHLRQRTNQALEKFVGSLSSQVLTQLDAIAGSRARPTRWHARSSRHDGVSSRLLTARIMNPAVCRQLVPHTAGSPNAWRTSPPTGEVAGRPRPSRDFRCRSVVRSSLPSGT
jgi:hypothetical protein